MKLFGLSKNNFLLPNVPNELKEFSEIRELLVNYNNSLKAILNSLVQIDSNWSDYGATSTIVGWASFTTKLIYYKKIGNTVFVSFYLAGTSNATGVSFTLPYTNSNTVETEVVGRAVDNGGGAVPALVFVPANTNVAYMCSDTSGSGGTWTASGTKQAFGQFFYDVQS